MKIARPNHSFQIVAHRGLPEDYPENTLIAYKHALMLHIDMLEIDVHYTKDKQLVVIHDDTIDRTSNGKGKVIDYTLDELREFDFGAYRGDKFKGERIPTLDEVLDLVDHFSKKLLLEIKKPSQYPGIEEMIVEKLKERGMPKHKVILQSFDFDCVKKLAEMNLEFELGVLLSKKQYWYKLPNFKEIAKVADYANPNYALVTKRFMKHAHEEMLKVLPYTVNESKAVKKLIDVEVDGVISDIPEDIFKL
ncbi:glycerophosphodiester phosphodiesterase [Staphylococcus caprae]|uniref:glycerophosphodiester phosphodiesterase n=1 Tax=Staphylococcus caprae TaxID=29380 RepID=UPI0001AAC5F2|nr:glycerophosphodiester phosphodiesterase family protein [Staphylococcus caprae]EES39863.1 glycerophosphodiester phosphodiesterase family protein [Staphylococcus caprae M23864:W1]MBN6825853.1 glycerophosphodiester phosphodiesterase [Staphylococcus caprae]MBX5315834.1 glycerophosphodiester phosphodiesterase [Staphylococcus caprae]MBX5322840.1 glycerophosphodiester phosphodiesterase [Staphylococcus caprae]MDI0014082.1 glycerophosphodiester phosphodiesterase family protein [Staphylococcus caprae